MPGIPDFTNPRWQVSRSDDQIARIIIQGRGAVMPPFRGTLTLEEAWAMAQYLRKFLPGSEESRPDDGRSGKAEKSDRPDGGRSGKAEKSDEVLPPPGRVK
jgi:mono/diheme cytochrome c family protein